MEQIEKERGLRDATPGTGAEAAEEKEVRSPSPEAARVENGAEAAREMPALPGLTEEDAARVEALIAAERERGRAGAEALRKERDALAARLKRDALRSALAAAGAEAEDLAALLAEKADPALILPAEDGSFDATAAAEKLKKEYPSCFSAAKAGVWNPPLTPWREPDPDSLSDEEYYRRVFRKRNG